MSIDHGKHPDETGPFVCECCEATHPGDNEAAMHDGWTFTWDGWLCPRHATENTTSALPVKDQLQELSDEMARYDEMEDDPPHRIVANWAERLRALAQPAEAVEGDETDPTALQIEYARGYGDGVKHGEQLRPTAAVSPEELRLYVSEQEACELERSHDAAQGAVAEVYAGAFGIHYIACADPNKLPVGTKLYTHPQAAPAQGDGKILVDRFTLEVIVKALGGARDRVKPTERDWLYDLRDAAAGMLAAAPSQEGES